MKTSSPRRKRLRDGKELEEKNVELGSSIGNRYGDLLLKWKCRSEAVALAVLSSEL